MMSMQIASYDRTRHYDEYADRYLRAHSTLCWVSFSLPKAAPHTMRGIHVATSGRTQHDEACADRYLRALKYCAECDRAY